MRAQLTKDTQEESCGEKTRVALYQTLHDCNETEQDHVSRKPCMGCELLHQHVCWNFE
jgi:hypothetical protein